jgi:hypothetical protein
MEKLKEVAQVLFSTMKGVQYADQLGKPGNPKPELLGLDRDELKVGDSVREVKLTGKNFVKTSSALVDGRPYPTKLLSDGSLVVTLAPEDLATPAEKQIKVVNPPPGGGASEPRPLTIT